MLHIQAFIIDALSNGFSIRKSLVSSGFVNATVSIDVEFFSVLETRPNFVVSSQITEDDSIIYGKRSIYHIMCN